MPSRGAPAGSGTFRRLAEGEFLGRKGRSLAGSHRDRGLFIACGPRVRAIGAIDAGIADVSATLLARMNVGVPGDLDGRVLHELLRAAAPLAAHGARPLSAADSAASLPEANTPLPPSAADSARPAGGALNATDAGRVEARLRRLGYIE
jgi:hypothetical protein